MNVNDYLTQMLRLIFVYLFIYLWNLILPGIYVTLASSNDM